jgi:acetoin utilization deacetylase AcuC-like enzyme
MKVVFHEDFYQVYTSDPAAAAGRMEAIVEIIEPEVEFVKASPAKEEEITLAHTKAHIDFVHQTYVLDIDLHYGDGTVNILEGKDYVRVHNMEGRDRHSYLAEIKKEMDQVQVDLIGVCAGFDNHQDDWGGLLTTEDYLTIGQLVKTASLRCRGGCFAILEGGYNHRVLGQNVLALIQGLRG